MTLSYFLNKSSENSSKDQNTDNLLQKLYKEHCAQMRLQPGQIFDDSLYLVSKGSHQLPKHSNHRKKGLRCQPLISHNSQVKPKVKVKLTKIN